MNFCRTLVSLLCIQCLFFTVACGEKPADEHRASNLIPEEEFVALLVDFSLCESASGINIKQVSNLNFDSVYAFRPLQEKNIRQSQYDSTLLYYSHHIDEYKLVYEKVIDRINTLQAEARGASDPTISK